MLWCYLKEAVDCPVPDSRFSRTLTNEVLQVILKALLVLQEAHGYIIVCFTFVQLCEEDPTNKRHVQIGALTDFLYVRVVKTDINSLVMEGFDVINVPKDSVLLAADFRWCIRAVCVLHVMEGEEVDIFYELGFTINQVLDQLAGGMTNLVMICSIDLITPR